MTSPDPFRSGRRVRVVGVGRTGTGAVPSLSYPALQAPRCGYSIRDGGRVTGVSGWDPGHRSATPVAVAALWAFNAAQDELAPPPLLFCRHPPSGPISHW